MRKLLVIIIIAVIIITISWLGYLAWQKLNNTGVIIKQETRADTEQKTINDEQQKLIRLTENSIANFWISATSSQVFLINYDGKIEKLESLKTKTIVSENGLKNISQVISSPDGSKALINLTIFDSATNLWTSLPVGTTSAAWNPSLSSGPSVPKIAYLTNDGIYNLNLKDGKTSLVLKLNNRDWQISWPFADEIYLNRESSWKVNLKDKTLIQVPNIIWSKAGWGIDLDNLSIVDKARKKLVDLEYLIPGKEFNILPPKCLVAENGFYCAVPNQDEVTLDDYLKRKVYTNDNFYFVSINTETKKTQVKLLLRADDNNPVDATNLALYKDKLLFINRFDQRLYSLELK